MPEKIVFEKISATNTIWNPTIPKYRSGDAGIDLHAATRVVAEEVPASMVFTELNECFTTTTDSVLKVESLQQALDTRLRLYQATVRTGLRVALPWPYHMRIASRSGLGFSKGIYAFPGTIDNSYRGEIMIKLIQFTDCPDPFVVEVGDRVAQGILFSVPEVTIVEGNVPLETHRGEKGFGSSGR